MTLSSWTGREVFVAIVLYWLCLGVGSALWVRRPGLEARQAGARAAASPVLRSGENPGEFQLQFSSQVDLTRTLLLVLVPPALLVLGWFFL